MGSFLSRLFGSATTPHDPENRRDFQRSHIPETIHGSQKASQSLGSIREVVIDVETTGFSPRHGDRIVSIALVEILNYREIGKRLVLRVNPRRKIPIEASKIHGIFDADVSLAPTFSELSQRILDFIGNSSLVGYNVGFDLSFLRYELETAGVELASITSVDVMELVSRHSGGRRRLHVACSDYGVDLAGVHAHSAEDDAFITALLYAKLHSHFSADEWDLSRFRRFTSNDAGQRTYENDILEKAWREFQAKNYESAIKLVNEVIDAGAALDVDALPYELGAMILRRLKRLDAERDMLLTYFRRAFRSDITIEDIEKLSEPPPMVMLTESEFNELEISGPAYRPTPYVWEMATRVLRVIELGKPIEDRLYKALKAIPLPYGYEEVAISLRKIITDKERKKESVSAQLDALYRFAQQHAFLYEEVFDKRLDYPVHVIVEDIPRYDLQSIQAPYDEVGYTFLPLLKKSDIRRLVAERGEPRAHASMRKKLNTKWEGYHTATYERLRSGGFLNWAN